MKILKKVYFSSYNNDYILMTNKYTIGGKRLFRNNLLSSIPAHQWKL